MALSPLDLQTTIGHTNDVARVRHLENEQAALQQHNLDAKSVIDSQKNKDTVPQTPKSEDIPITLPDGRSQNRRKGREREKSKGEDNSAKEHKQLENPLLGSHIDVTR